MSGRRQHISSLAHGSAAPSWAVGSGGLIVAGCAEPCAGQGLGSVARGVSALRSCSSERTCPRGSAHRLFPDPSALTVGQVFPP